MRIRCSTLIAAGAFVVLTLGFLARADQALAAAKVTTMHDTAVSTLKYSPTVKSFQEYRQAAEHDLHRSRSGWFPRIDARAGFGIEQWSDSQTRSSTYRQGRRDYYSRSEASITISQTIWDGFDTRSRVDISQHKLDSAVSRLYDNAEGLVLDAILAHIDVYRHRRIIALAELNVKNHKAILESQNERYTSGASTLADVTQTQSRLARTEASLAESKAALTVALAAYKRYTGKTPGELEPPMAPNKSFPTLEKALYTTQTRNPKIAASTSDVKTAESQINLDKAPFHPNIYLEAGPSYSYRVESADDDKGGMAIMLRANWNLLNGGYDWFNVKGDKARARQSRQELEALKDSLTEETEKTWSEYLSAQDLANHYAKSVDYSTKTRDMYLEQFNVGQRSLLDVLDSENELFSSSIQLVTAQQNVLAAQYRLKALGGELIASFGLDRGELNIKTDDKPSVGTAIGRWPDNSSKQTQRGMDFPKNYDPASRHAKFPTPKEEHTRK